jgi:hypothetical protein
VWRNDIQYELGRNRCGVTCEDNPETIFGLFARAVDCTGLLFLSDA